MTKAVGEAEKRFFLSENSYTVSFDLLDIEVPGEIIINEPQRQFKEFAPGSTIQLRGDSNLQDNFYVASAIDTLLSYRYFPANNLWLCSATTQSPNGVQLCKMSGDPVACPAGFNGDILCYSIK